MKHNGRPFIITIMGNHYNNYHVVWNIHISCNISCDMHGTRISGMATRDSHVVSHARLKK